MNRQRDRAPGQLSQRDAGKKQPSPAALKNPIPARTHSRHWTWVGAVVLVAAVIFAYNPAWRAGFIWDDDVYVTQNPLLTASDGLTRIWFSQDSPSQYFPLVYTTFRFERELWGLNPAGYHWVNILLHAATALLVWRLLRKLRAPGAWLAAALFALHPVQVESVAWITERKNVLSLLFYLLALCAWVDFVQSGTERGRWKFYGLAVGCYLLALFSKTVACTLPAALLLVLWLRREPLTRARWFQLSPFVMLGLGMGLLTVWWERHHMGTSGGVFAMSFLERALVASRAIWFYASKLLWPANLSFSYPRWVIDPRDPKAYLWLAAGLLLVAFVVWRRRQWGRGPETALLYYVAVLSPLLGFVMLFTFRYTFVADHYQYAASIGPLALIAAGIATVFDRLRASWATRAVASAIPLILLATLTWRQARIYQNPETLWRDTIAKNPESWLAYSNLGQHLLHQQRFEEAVQQFEAGLRMNPKDVDALVSLGNAMFGRGRQSEAQNYYQQALAVNPNNPEAHVNLAVILANRGQLDEAIEHNRQAIQVNPRLAKAHSNLAVALTRKGLFEEALPHYEKAVELSPGQALPHVNFALALQALGRNAQAKEQYEQAAIAVDNYAKTLIQQKRLAEARAQYEESIRMIPDNARAHCGLGHLWLGQGQREMAAQEFRLALQLRPDYPEAQEGLQRCGTR